jgi:nucleoside-diphosphate-sugar epimerase
VGRRVPRGAEVSLRHFIYVKDVAKANLLGLESPIAGVYNVGSGKPVSILEVAKIF